MGKAEKRIRVSPEHKVEIKTPRFLPSQHGPLEAKHVAFKEIPWKGPGSAKGLGIFFFLKQIYQDIDLCTIRLTHLKHTCQWILVCSLICAPIPRACFRTFSAPQYETLYLSPPHLSFLVPQFEAAANQTFCLYAFTYSGHFIDMVSCNLGAGPRRGWGMLGR